MGTRSTLLDARPQDYSSSGYIDWPFMTTHSWGENPQGTWVLEIHNDAYSKWAAEAKFFKWSLELHGVKFDPNSENYRKNEAAKNNVVREAPAHMMPRTTTTSTTTTPRTTTTASAPSTHLKGSLSIGPQPTLKDVYIPRGCVSKRSQCTQEVTNCRTFTHRSVAQVFCRCSRICLEVASIGVDSFNMQCLANDEKKEAPRSLEPAINMSKDVPFYCQFIPFLNNNWQQQLQTDF